MSKQSSPTTKTPDVRDIAPGARQVEAPGDDASAGWRRLRPQLGLAWGCSCHVSSLTGV